MIKQSSSLVRPYFDVKWDGIEARDAFIDAKLAAMENLQHQIRDIEDLTFDEFAQHQCAQDVKPETVRRLCLKPA